LIARHDGEEREGALPGLLSGQRHRRLHVRIAARSSRMGFKQSLLPLTHISGMKVVALVAGLLVGGSYIDSHYFHGYYFRAALSMAQQIATHTGLRR
jgi:hypothetical protein